MATTNLKEVVLNIGGKLEKTLQTIEYKISERLADYLSVSYGNQLCYCDGGRGGGTSGSGGGSGGPGTGGTSGGGKSK